MPDIYVDADACPVKDEIYRVAGRYGLKVILVSNRGVRPPSGVRAELVVVGSGLDAADDWIAGRIGQGDIVVTADVPLAARCLARGAEGLAPNGRRFTQANIGNAVATRDLMTHLREIGERTGGPPPMTRRDRSQFLSALDATVQAVRRRDQTTGSPSG